MKPALLIGVIGLALTGLLGYHGYKRQQERARLIQTQIGQEQANQEAQAEVAALAQQIEQYRAQLSPEPDPSWLARNVTALGRKAGLELTTITQESPQPFAQFTRLAVNLNFSANYHQLGTFFDDLEQSDSFIRVEHLDVSSPKETGGRAVVHVVLSTLYLPPVFAEADASGSRRN